jgi:ABC-type Fe3+-hydroxamate transport system substrate-binding protein
VVAAARAAVAQTSSGVRSAARSSSSSSSSSSSGGSSGSGGAEPAAASDAPPAEAVAASESNKPETVASKSEETTTVVEAPSNIVSLEPVLELVAKTAEPAKDEKAEPAPTVTTTETKSDEDANLRKIYSGAAQSGWGYESLSKTSRNYANIVLPINTAIQIYIVQDNMVAAKNFSSGRPQGQIVINQTFR